MSNKVLVVIFLALALLSYTCSVVNFTLANIGNGVCNLLTALTDTLMAYVVIRMEIRERKTAHIFDFLEKVITKGIDVEIVKEEKAAEDE